MISFNPTLSGGGVIMPPPPSEISSCSLGIAFWVTQVGWQFISTLILSGNICFWAKNYIEKVLEYHFWSKGHFSRSMRGIFLKFQRHVRGQHRGFWGCPGPFQGDWHKFITCSHLSTVFRMSIHNIIFITQKCVRSQSRVSWGCQTQLHHTCPPRAFHMSTLSETKILLSF